MGAFLPSLPVANLFPKLATVVIADTLSHVERGEFERVVVPGKAGNFDMAVAKVGEGMGVGRVVV